MSGKDPQLAVANNIGRHGRDRFHRNGGDFIKETIAFTSRDACKRGFVNSGMSRDGAFCESQIDMG